MSGYRRLRRLPTLLEERFDESGRCYRADEDEIGQGSLLDSASMEGFPPSIDTPRQQSISNNMDRPRSSVSNHFIPSPKYEQSPHTFHTNPMSPEAGPSNAHGSLETIQRAVDAQDTNTQTTFKDPSLFQSNSVSKRAKVRLANFIPTQPIKSLKWNRFVTRINHNLTYLIRPPPDKTDDGHVKIVMVGDGACGKTTASLSFLNGKLHTDQSPTISSEHRAKIGKIDLTIVDTSGLEDYEEIRRSAYPDSDVIVVCFAIDNMTTLENVLANWMEEIRRYRQEIPPIVLVGMKSDLREEELQLPRMGLRRRQPVKYSEGLDAAREIGAVAYVECSAQRMTGLADLYNAAALVGFYHQGRHLRSVRRYLPHRILM